MTIKDYLEDFGITKQELSVIQYTLQGKSIKEIAQLLFITDKTVKFHNTHIYKKLKLKGRSELIVELTRVSNGFEASNINYKEFKELLKRVEALEKVVLLPLGEL